MPDVVAGNGLTVPCSSAQTARAKDRTAPSRRSHAMAMFQGTQHREWGPLRAWVEEMEAGPEYLKRFGKHTANQEVAKLYAEVETAKMLLLAQDRKSKWQRDMAQPNSRHSDPPDHPASEFAISKRRDGQGGCQRGQKSAPGGGSRHTP